MAGLTPELDGLRKANALFNQGLISIDEIDEYAKWLGMDLVADKDLQWIAREGLKAPLPEHWKPCKTTDTDEIYYFNFSSGESTWDHPCDGQ